MAIHEDIDLEKKPLEEWINTDALRNSAIKASKLLSFFPELRPWEVHEKDPSYKDNSWLVGLPNSRDPILFNIKIMPSNLNIEFHYPQYLPLKILSGLRWQSRTWAYANYNVWGEDLVVDMIQTYLTAILPDYHANKLKSGGKSSSEALIRRHLEHLFPGKIIHPNIRLDKLRSMKGRPLEFDLWLPNLMLAIEIQGPQHFKKIYGDNSALVANDQYKLDWCLSEGIKMVWLNWDGLTSGLFRLPEDDQRRHLREILETLLAGDHSFLLWNNTSSYEFT